VAVARFEVYLVNLDPTVGSEIRKTRPCVVLSPDELNRHSRLYIVAPLTSGRRAYPFRVACEFQGVPGYVVLDQLRTVDRGRFVRRLGVLPQPACSRALAVLASMFAP
jgi:mRNA interferase MazF